MFFHITIHRIKAVHVSDHPMDPFDTAIEAYQTWHLAELEALEATSASTWARQGSSSRGAPDSGISLRNGDDVVPVDPQITLGLPDNATQTGQHSQYRLDFHFWDSDSATEKVRAAFTDMTLQYMVAAFKAANQNAQAARAALEAWLSANWKDAAKKIAAAVAPTGPWTAIGLDLLPMVDLLIDVVKNDGDDYFQMHRFILQRRGDGAAVEWQVTDPSGAPSGWKKGAGALDIVQRVMDGPRRNILDVTYRFRLVV